MALRSAQAALLSNILTILLLATPSLSFAATAAQPECDTVLAGQAQEIEATFHSAYQDLIAQDNQFVQAMNTQPVLTHLNLREKALVDKKGKRDFPFAPHRPIVERVVRDLEQRLTRKFGDKHKVALTAALKKARSLLAAGDPPYKATVRFMMYQYLPALNLILAERHPHLKYNDFHQRNAAHKIEPFLTDAPDMFLYFSFGWVDDDFFVNSRPALMNMIGINLDGLDDVSEAPYADMYFMNISEFGYHDAGHAEFTSEKDLIYIRKERKPLVRIEWEWENTRLRIKAVVDQVKARDKDLGEAMNTILFELLRERGFQYSLTVLKQELETQKWTDVLLRKYQKGFYQHYGTNPRKFERLDEARQNLVTAVERLREEDQLAWIHAIHAEVVPAVITHTPALIYATGRMHSVLLSASGPAEVVVKTDGNQQMATQMRELVSAQVSPTKASPLNSETLIKIGQALARPDVKNVSIQPNKSIFVIFENGKRQDLALIKFDSNHAVARLFENIEVFEINQVLGSEERGEQISFTVRQPTQTYVGTIMTQKDLVTGRHHAFIKTLKGETVDRPLVQLRIDPL